MKTKKLMLGLVAFTFAIGSAFASLLLIPQYTYVKAIPVGGGPGECLYIGQLCDNGPEICTVYVNAQYGPKTTSFTYREPACTISVGHSTTFTRFSTVQVQQLLEP